MNISPRIVVNRIAGIALVVADLERSIIFYCEGLGFRVESRGASDGANAITAILSLGGVLLRLDQPASLGAAYPAKRSANDPWFQHFAIRVADMDAAWARLSGHHSEPISTGGPQRLPASSGSVIAYKFRDPDGHPLELSQYPDEEEGSDGSPFLAVDHSAIAVSNLDASIFFYGERLGFRLAERLVNQGPTQWRLDGLDGAVVDIVVLKPPAAGPHLELLHYRSPSPTAPLADVAKNDIVATRLLVTASNGGDLLMDPDGHLVECVEAR